jgi:hypothetical protein
MAVCEPERLAFIRLPGEREAAIQERERARERESVSAGFSGWEAAFTLSKTWYIEEIRLDRHFYIVLPCDMNKQKAPVQKATR